jgi:hypothetical protein
VVADAAVHVLDETASDVHPGTGTTLFNDHLNDRQGQFTGGCTLPPPVGEDLTDACAAGVAPDANTCSRLAVFLEALAAELGRQRGT